MDDSWRFRPIQSPICPICSISHVPFCPPPPPTFDRNGFSGEIPRHHPPDPRTPFHRPFLDPSPPLPPSLWGAAAPIDREPPRLDFQPPLRFHSEEISERESFSKRMRVEGPSPPFNRYDLPPIRTSSADERVLNLIRDHGQHTTYDTGSRYQHGIVGPDRGFYSSGISPPLPPEPLFSYQNHPLPTNSYEGYRDFPVGSGSQILDGFLQRKDLQRGEFDTSGSGIFNPQVGEEPYGRVRQCDNSSELTQSYRHGEPHATVERSFYHSHSHSQVLDAAYDYGSRGSFEKYYDHGHQRLNENPASVFPKQPQYLHNDSNQLPSNLPTREQESGHSFHATRYPLENKFEIHGQHVEAMRTPLEIKPPFREQIYNPFDYQTYPVVEQPGGPSFSKQGGYMPIPGNSNDPGMHTAILGQEDNTQIYPLLPLQRLLEVHKEPPTSNFQVTPSMPMAPPVLNHAPANNSVTALLPPNVNFSEPHPPPENNFYRDTHSYASPFTNEGAPIIHQTSPNKLLEERGQTFPFRHSLKDEATVIDASHLFKHPKRASRPDHIVIILRGLPGSGKSYLAKAIRDVEVESGGSAPRIHAMDDYFMIEVEKVEDNDGSKSSTFRGKKQITKKVVEYCYEPEMEEAYRASMLKAFKKTLDEGIFTFIIVDDRNLRVADFAQFWAIAKRSGYEVYLLEAAYKDPAGCTARNVHGFTLDDIQKMAEQWEEAPSLYLRLDVQSLFHGDDLNEHSIKEVDMDTDDTDCDVEDMRQLPENWESKMTGSESLDQALDDGFKKVGDRWETEEDEELPRAKELERSKWSRDLDEDTENPDGIKENLNALSGLIQAYGKGEKSVHWGDQAGKGGFSIGGVKKMSISSLVIGPGSGYNMNSNPLVEEEGGVDSSGRMSVSDSKRRFHEQLRAERDSFKAAFDTRRQRIGGLFNADDD